jgi:AcrR family transcriptional regulator
MLTKETRVSRRGRKPPKPSLKPRRTPIQERSAGTIATILEAATQVLEKRGLAGFNTNAVAERAGVSIGSLYQYFPGKEAILAALLERYEAELFATVSDSLAASRGGTLQECLRGVVDALIATHVLSPNLHRILEGEEQRLQPDNDARPQASEAIVRLVAKMLREHHVRLPGVSIADAAEDLCIIVRALIDAALAASSGPIDRRRRRRILRAIEGYLLIA